MAKAELNLDQADKYTDDELDAIVSRLDYIYRKAYKEMKEKRDKSFSSFLKADKEKQKLVESGEWTEEQWRQWRLGWMHNDNKMSSLINDYARKATEANQTASEYINSKTPEIFAYNHNFTAYEFEKNTGIAFSIVDKNTVKELATGKNHVEFRTLSVNKKATYNWNKEKITRDLTAGIIQGKSIPDIAKDFYKTMGSNKKASVRNARTAVTSAQNGGRMQGLYQAKDMGINVQKKWISAHDDRVRDSHRELDGETVDVDKPFSNGLMYPSDPKGEPSEVYNCRCTMRGVVGKAKKTNIGSFELWEEGKKSSFLQSAFNSAKYLYDAFDKGDLYKNMPSNMKINFERGLKTADPAISRVVRKYRNDINYIYGYSRNFFFHGSVYLKNDSEGGSIVHEMFHGVDAINNYVSDRLTKPLQSDKKRIVSIAEKNNMTVREFIQVYYPQAFKENGKFKDEYRGVSDILSGMFGIKFGKGHSKEYWNSGNNKLEKEALAQYGRIQYDNNEEVKTMFRDLFEYSYEQMKEIVENL